jgi:hypothetical protein
MRTRRLFAAAMMPLLVLACSDDPADEVDFGNDGSVPAKADAGSDATTAADAAGDNDAGRDATTAVDAAVDAAADGGDDRDGGVESDAAADASTDARTDDAGVDGGGDVSPDGGDVEGSGETCRDPLEIIVPLDGSEVTVTGDTATARDDVRSRCQGAVGARDRVHVVKLAGTAPAGYVEVTGRPIVESDDVSMAFYAMRGSCSADGDGAECFSVASSRITYDARDQVLRYVVVDAAAANRDVLAFAGRYELRARFVATPVPSNDRCEDAAVVSLPSDASVVRLDGTTRGARNDATAQAPSCHASPRAAHRDVFYSVRTPADLVDGDRVRLVAKSSAFTPVLYAWEGGCGDRGTDLGCNAATGGESSVVFEAKPSTTYTVVVDGLSDAPDSPAVFNGPFTLEAQVVKSAVTGACNGDAPLLNATGRNGSIRGRLSDASRYEGRDLGCTNAGGNGGDSVLRVVLPPRASLTADVTADNAQTDLVLYSSRSCPGSNPAPRCLAFRNANGLGSANRNRETITLRNDSTRDEWTVFLVVDEVFPASGRPAGGGFRIDWRIED